MVGELQRHAVVRISTHVDLGRLDAVKPGHNHSEYSYHSTAAVPGIIQEGLLIRATAATESSVRNGLSTSGTHSRTVSAKSELHSISSAVYTWNPVTCTCMLLLSSFTVPHRIGGAAVHCGDVDPQLRLALDQ